ncbi:allophycocyanin [Synechococcales cyanobacterium C]|uniref:Allophycocyanin n=1 Tax=Petrachloros mirabilis ULC683 TaxID=2781853 RepID=A0A8K2A868_9CYAN|nr:allophycocyanin [Petrachloros mirabilis]NCJ07671.1 allophycocyanin [Petrachloros mirabilis ULC683]
MLQQLARLSVEADGRFATAQELQFIKDYLESVDDRISAYETIREAEETLMQQVEAKVFETDPEAFTYSGKDTSEISRRDRKHYLWCSAAAVLVDDIDRLQNTLLLWQRTLVHAFKFSRTCQAVNKVMPEVLKQHLSDEEFALMLPVLQLNYAVLR